MASCFGRAYVGLTRIWQYCFETPTWRELGLTVVQLGQVSAGVRLGPAVRLTVEDRSFDKTMQSS